VEERLGAWLDHVLEQQVEERAGATGACLDAARQMKRKRHGSMDFNAILNLGLGLLCILLMLIASVVRK
jgi:hypothetical protein